MVAATMASRRLCSGEAPRSVGAGSDDLESNRTYLPPLLSVQGGSACLTHVGQAQPAQQKALRSIPASHKLDVTIILGYTPSSKPALNTLKKRRKEKKKKKKATRKQLNQMKDVLTSGGQDSMVPLHVIR